MSQNPFKINGGAVAAVMGENCIGIASDKRLGVQFTMVTANFQKVYRMQENILLGLSGLASDCLTLYKKLRYKLNMYRIREGKDMTANTFAHLVGTTLYSHRYYCRSAFFGVYQLWEGF
jgi:20S proteasome subunit beta 3